MVVPDEVLVLGTAVRLTRLVTTDNLGTWLIKDPIDRAMERYEDGHVGGEEPWWWKFRSGLDCPFCVGFWIGASVLLSYRLVGSSKVWKFAATALTLNEIAGRLAQGDADDH